MRLIIEKYRQWKTNADIPITSLFTPAELLMVFEWLDKEIQIQDRQRKILNALDGI